MALTLQGPPQHAIYQRRAGTAWRDVPVRFAYTGSPGAVSARAVRAATGAVVRDWTPLSGQSLSGGLGYGTLPGVPQGDGYRLDVRDGAGVVTQGTTTWGVGVCMLFAGQSNMGGTLYAGFWYDGEFKLYDNSPKLFRVFDDAGWGLARNDGLGGDDGQHAYTMGRKYLGRMAVEALGNSVPVGWLEMKHNGTGIDSFLPGGEDWQRVVAASGPGLAAGGAAAGLTTPDFGDFELFVWHQGESDSGATTAQYKAKLQTLVTGLLGVVAPYGRDATTLTVGLSIVEGQDPNGYNNGQENVRRAVLEFVAEGRAAGKRYDVASSTLDLFSDGLHFGDLEGRRNCRRYAQLIRKTLAGAAHSGRGPAISSITRSGNDFLVTVAHEGGTTLRTQTGAAPTGFYISHDGFSADKRLPASVAITGANTIKVSGSGLPATAALKYQGAIPGNPAALSYNDSSNDGKASGGIWTGGPFDGSAYPDIRAPVYDNAALPPDLADTPWGDQVTGLPLLPLLADVRLADGQTWTAPAGYTAAAGAGTGTPAGNTGTTGGTTGGQTGNTGGTGATTPTAGTGTGTATGMEYYKIKDGRVVADASGGLFVSAGAGAAMGTGGTPTPKVTGVSLTPVELDGLAAAWNAYAGTSPAATEYRLEGRPAGTTAWQGWGITSAVPGQGTYSATKRGLTAGGYDVRVVPKKGPNYPDDDIVAGASDPVTTRVGASAGAGTGTSTGGATGNTALYTGTIEALRLTAAVPTLPVQLRVEAEEAVAAPPVCCAHPFGPGDVPAGSRVRLRTAGGAEIAVQQDDETTWPDGSLKYAVLSFVAPDTFAAGQIVPYTVDAVTGTPNRTASHSLAQLAAGSDFRLEVKGFHWGGDVGVMRVNDLISANRVAPWGVNPKSGIEAVASGPIRQEWRFWAVAKRRSDGALHESVRLELYIRRWAATGAFEVLGRQRQPNLDAAYYGSTWSTTGWNQGNAGVAECFNGTSRVFAMGGPNDRDARTVPPSQFLPAEGKYNFPADQNIGQISAIDGSGNVQWYGMGVPLGFAGNAPGGMNTSTPYYFLSDWRIASRRNDGEAGVSFTAPAGECTVFPLVASYPGTGVVFADEQGDPYWVGAGPRPRVRVGHDAAYLTRASRLFLPMDLTQPRPAEPATGGTRWPFHPYRPNQVLGQTWWDWGLEGDNYDADRVGWLSRQHANLLLTPFDRVRRTHCFALAYMQNDGHFDWEDQRSGRVYACNNTQYPELASPLPTLYISQYQNDGANSATPGFAAMAWWNKGGSGYTARYNNLGEASHWPSWQVVPHLLNGHRVHLDLQRTGTAVMAAVKDAGLRNRNLKPPQVPAARTFYTIFHDQPRSLGWQRIALSNLRHTLPDNHPERAYFDAFAEENATYYGAIAPHSPWKLYGKVPIGPGGDGDMSLYDDGHASYQDGDNIGFHMVYQTLGAIVCRYRGEAAWDPAIDVYLGYLRDCADDRQYPDGSGFFTGHYGTTFRRADGALFPTRREWIQDRAAAEMGASPPYPDNSNWAGDNRRSGYDPYMTTKYDVQQVAVLAMASWIAKPDGTARFPGCDRVRLQLINRLAGTPGGTGVTRYRFADDAQPGKMTSAWSLLPSNMG